MAEQVGWDQDFSELSLEEAVFQALGAASMCWDETPKGVFDSTRAKAIGDALYKRIGSSQEFHDDGTLTKVYEALSAAGLGQFTVEAQRVVNELQNHGILFRERNRAD